MKDMSEEKECKHKWSKRNYVAIQQCGYPVCKENSYPVYVKKCLKKCGMILSGKRVKP